MANPILLFENVLEDGTITSSSETSGWDDDNVIDWRTSPRYRWKPNTTTPDAWIKLDLGAGQTASPDTVAIGGHNLWSIAATVKVEYSDDGSSWSDAYTAETPSADTPYMATWTGSAHRYWRVTISRGGSFPSLPQIGVCTLGRRLELDGVLPDIGAYDEEAVADWVLNENGFMLGSNLRYVRKYFQLSYQNPGFTHDAFFQPASGLTFDLDYVPHVRSKPFWWAWNLDREASHVWLCRTVGQLNSPFIGTTSRRALIWRFEATQDAV